VAAGDAVAMISGKAEKISVVMSVFNGGAELEPTLRSVFDQDFESFEFIVIDDGSADGSGDVLDRWAKSESRLRVEHRANQGLTVALRLGCELARGEYIARQDCGDRSLPGRLRSLAARLDADPGVVLVASNYRHLAPDGELLSIVKAHAESGELRRRLLAGEEAILAGPHHGTVMFRRETYLEVGGYRPDFYFAQDIDLWTRLMEVGAIAWVDEELCEVRHLRGSITATHGTRQRALRALIAEAVRLRTAGRDENSVLARARAIRPDSLHRTTRGDEDIDYFVGSCLADRGDPAARRYLAKVIARRPWMLKAWAKLALTWLPAR
jgi:glycosyltransferase involved in cell wall biosynthesis